MVLFRQGDTWHVRIKAKPLRLTVALSSTTLKDAVVEAEGLYTDSVAIAGGNRCFQCIHWEAVAAECGLGFPEGRTSGGSHAKHCPAFMLPRKKGRV